MNQVDQHAIEYYGYDNQGGSCINIPTKDTTKQWLDELRKDDDKWYEHLEREREYQERKAKDFLY